MNNEEIKEILDGKEIYVGETLYLIDIEENTVWDEGKAKKITDSFLKKALKEYFNNSLNDGYWLLKDLSEVKK